MIKHMDTESIRTQMVLSIKATGLKISKTGKDSSLGLMVHPMKAVTFKAKSMGLVFLNGETDLNTMENSI